MNCWPLCFKPVKSAMSFKDTDAHTYSEISLQNMGEPRESRIAGMKLSVKKKNDCSLFL